MSDDDRLTMYDDILIPTDGGESTDRVLPHARDIAGRRDATVHALSVIDDRSFFALDDETERDASAQLRAKGDRATGRVADELEADGHRVTTAVTRGDPATEICDYASEVDADVILMGTRGDEYTENMLGSTAQRVVATADVPVLTVPLGESP